MEWRPGATREAQELQRSKDVGGAESGVGKDPVHGGGRMADRVHLASELVVSRFAQAETRMRQVAGDGADAARLGHADRR